MRQIRQTLRLHFEAGLSYAQVARAIPTAKATVGKIILLARAAGVDWALAQTLCDDELEARLYRAAGAAREPPARARLRPHPPGAQAPGRDAAAAVGGVPARACAAGEPAYKYTQLLRQVRRLGGQPQALDAPDPPRRRAAVRRLRRPDACRSSMRRAARSGRAQVFVAVLGASNYTYACATGDADRGRLDRRASSRRWSSSAACRG